MTSAAELALKVVSSADLKGLSDTEKALKKLTDQASAIVTPGKAAASALDGIRNIAAGFTIGSIITELPGILSRSANAAAQDAASQTQLNQALANAGLEGYAAQLENAAQRAMAFGVADDQARQSLALLVAQTGSAEEAQRRFTLAMDLSRGANIDLTTASRLVGRITEDNVNVLSRYGVTIEKGASETQALAAIQAKFGGQAQAFADGPAGSMARFNLAVGEAQESLGRAFGPALVLAAEAGAEAAHVLEVSFSIAGEVILGVADAIEGLASIPEKLGFGGAEIEIASLAEAEARLAVAHGVEKKALEDVIGQWKAASGAAGESSLAVDEFGSSEADAATKTDVLNAALDRQVNGLNLTRMGFTESVPGIQAHIQAIEAATAAFEGLTQAEIDYITGSTSPVGTVAAGGIPSFPVQGRASGGSVSAGELYRINESHTEFFRPSMSGEVIPIAPAGTTNNNNQRNVRIGVVNVYGNGQKDDVDMLLRRI